MPRLPGVFTPPLSIELARRDRDIPADSALRRADKTCLVQLLRSQIPFSCSFRTVLPCFGVGRLAGGDNAGTGRTAFAFTPRISFGWGQVILPAVNPDARRLLPATIVLARLFRVVVELFGQFSPDGPDFLQSFVTFRFHRLSPLAPAASPATASPGRAARSHAGCGRFYWHWPNADSSM